jgi:hypothetical protein
VRIAELFVELGFKVQGADKLKAFETSLTNAASAATRLVVAMRMLAGLKVPDAYKNLRAIKMSSAGPQPPVLNQPGAFDQPDTGTGIQKGLKDISKLLGIMGLAGILKSLITGLKNMVKESLKSQFELNQFTKQSRMTRDQMKQWEYLANKAGMSAEDVQQQMLGLQDRAQEIIMGKREPAAPSLGLPAEVGKPTDLLRQFEAATRNMVPEQMRIFAQAYGIDPRLIVALREFPDALESVNNELLMTKEQTKNVNDLNLALADLTFVTKERVISAFSELAPYITDLSRALESFLRDPLKAIRENQQGFQFGVRAVGGALPTTIGGELLRFISDFKTAGGRGNVTNNVTVNGSGEPRETANLIKRELSDFYYDRRSPFPYAPDLVSP